MLPLGEAVSLKAMQAGKPERHVLQEMDIGNGGEGRPGNLSPPGERTGKEPGDTGTRESWLGKNHMGEEEADDPEGKRSRQVTLERQDLKESTGASGTGARGGGLCGTGLCGTGPQAPDRLCSLDGAGAGTRDGLRQFLQVISHLGRSQMEGKGPWLPLAFP